MARKLVHRLGAIFLTLGQFCSMLEFNRCCPFVKKLFCFFDVGDYLPVSITPVLSKVFEKIVVVKLSHFLKDNSLLPPSQFSYQKSLSPCNGLLTLSHHL